MEDKNIYLGEKFINAVLDGVQTKDAMTSRSKSRYILRAMMSGIIVFMGYLTYAQIATNFATYSDPSGALGVIGKFLGATFFSLCLVAIYFTKSELLTSNMMMTTVGRYYRKINTRTMFKIMGLCFLGNIIGAILFSLFIPFTSIMTEDLNSTFTHIIETKYAYGPIDTIIRAILCNFMINFAMLVIYSGNAKDDFGKIATMFFSVFIFMYLGLEHSVANTVLFILAAIGGVDGVELVPSLINISCALVGNFIGGGVLIGVYYAFLNGQRPKK